MFRSCFPDSYIDPACFAAQTPERKEVYVLRFQVVEFYGNADRYFRLMLCPVLSGQTVPDRPVFPGIVPDTPPKAPV